MAEESKGPQVQLSGYQPSKEASGLHLMAQSLYEAFMKALIENDQTGETLRFPVVGVLEGRVGHIGRPGIDKDPSIELRFVSIEPVLNRDAIDGDPPKQVVELMLQLRDIRLGEQPVLFDGDGAGLPAAVPDVDDPLSFPDVDAYVNAVMNHEFGAAEGAAPTEAIEAEETAARERYFAAVKAASEEELTTERPATGGETTNGKTPGRKAKATRNASEKVLTAHFSAT